ncbi:AAA family ATPase [Parafrigoribacterium mesophilum]|uniref:AAA family ATPase n=1 Tax=Parafrigoribacterium mesophilum TaxID=433646 RepID=UPI0031FDD61B
MDEQQTAFVETFRRFIDELINVPRPRPEMLTPLGEVVQSFLGTDVTALPLVTEDLPPHRLVDVDLALEALASQSPHSQLVGVSGGQQREQSAFPELLSNPFMRFAPGPVDYVERATGPDTSRQVVAFGLRLLQVDGHPLAVLQRGSRPEHGRPAAKLEVLTADPATSALFLARVRRLMLERSVLRGQVLSFTGNEYSPGAAGATFLPRPDVQASDIILPAGVLEDVAGHVVGIGEHRNALRAVGQHLKRGVLLYGPPGTGKTLTVRHLLSRTPGTTAVLLTGTSIRFITEAAELARAMQPAIVVLEDVDLVAAERGMFGGPQPLLFAVLDALDGLDTDADVAFILTTNRVDVLEQALAQRPGRVDLAMEIPLPDADCRRRLFALYARELPLSAAAVADAADRSEGMTGSFAKELMRRTVLLAAQEERPAADADLTAALDALLSAREHLTRSLLGGHDRRHPAPQS